MSTTVVIPATMSSNGVSHTYSDDSDPNTGLDAGGHVDRLVPMILDTVYVANYALTQAGLATTNSAAQVALATAQVGLATTQASLATTQATNAAASAAQAAQQANTLTSTSTTSTLIGTGSKIFVTQSGEQFITGQFVTIADSSTPANYMYGQVTSYSTTQLTVNVTSIGGGGTLASWNISLSGIKGDTGSLGSSIELGTTGANINVGNSAPPTAGQLLIATSATTATWQTTPNPVALSIIFGG